MSRLRIDWGVTVGGILVLTSCGSGTPDVASSYVDSGVTPAPIDSGSDADLPWNEYEAGPMGPIDSGLAGEAGTPDGGIPEVPIGAPIQAPDGVWTQVLFPGGYCRDGEQAHLMVHLNSNSKKMAVYLEGGGACFNDTSCQLLTSDSPTYTLGQGIFNFNNPANPIGDWNIFYVPYCSGDVHAGANPTGNPGPITGVQNYTGYTNLQLYLSRIRATVPDATDALLTGSSAGGVGVGLTASLVARYAPATVQRFTLLDDSGPPMSSQYIQPCLQDQWRTVWGLDNTFLHECGAACPTHNDWVLDWIQYLLNTYAKGPLGPKFMGGLISHATDLVISTFYGFGANNCAASAIPVPLDGAQFEAGLLGFRALLQSQTPSFGTYFVSGSTHTFLISDSANITQGGLYDTQVNGVKLTDWINDLLAHKQAPHVGP